MNRLLLILLSLTAIETITTLASKYAKHGCKDKCGKVRIPYPFGIGPKCSINEWYNVDCKSSTPYLSALAHLQVLGVDLENQTVTVNMPVSETKSVDLGRSPFLFSKLQNKFVFEGCGNAVMMDHGNLLTGCSTTCGNDSVSDYKNNCLGIRCCQATIPHHIKSYNMKLRGLEGMGARGSAFLVDKDSYLEGRYSIAKDNSYAPVSLLWTLSDRDSVSCCHMKSILQVDLGNGTSMDSLRCIYRSFVWEVEGNAYLNDGCRDTERCAECLHNGGDCNFKKTYVGASLLTKNDFTCISPNTRQSKLPQGVILGVSISMGVLFLVATLYVSYKVIMKTRKMRQRRRFFKRNGGLLLKQQEEAHPSLVNKTIHFTSSELEKATDSFNENRILGRGGQGTVYKGMLVDGKIVAIKKSKIVDQSQLQQFINEVVILSEVNHRNVVKLLGCCLETPVPLLVYEFIPNGTLYEGLHREADELNISYNMRLQIATEVAGAVAYLHSATSIPIYHRDIKTTNILLDEKYRAKVSDFGTSRFVSVDQTHLTTLVKGTFGYLDPQYFRSSQFTEKSDVYSFGVVLVELLTGEKPISQTRFEEHRSLVTYFMSSMEEGHVLSIFDATVVKEGTEDELLALASLAMRCLNLNGKYRPTMNEVVTELETIQTSHLASTVQTNTRPLSMRTNH